MPEKYEVIFEERLEKWQNLHTQNWPRVMSRATDLTKDKPRNSMKFTPVKILVMISCLSNLLSSFKGGFIFSASQTALHLRIWQCNF